VGHLSHGSPGMSGLFPTTDGRSSLKPPEDHHLHWQPLDPLTKMRSLILLKSVIKCSHL
jgi:hypothetical protein